MHCTGNRKMEHEVRQGKECISFCMFIKVTLGTWVEISFSSPFFPLYLEYYDFFKVDCS